MLRPVARYLRRYFVGDLEIGVQAIRARQDSLEALARSSLDLAQASFADAFNLLADQSRILADQSRRLESALEFRASPQSR